MKAKLKPINGMRWMRMGIGLFFIFAGLGEKKWGVSLIGGFIFIQGMMDWGCGFSKNSCGVTNTEIPDSVPFVADHSIKKIPKR